MFVIDERITSARRIRIGSQHTIGGALADRCSAQKYGRVRAIDILISGSDQLEQQQGIPIKDQESRPRGRTGSRQLRLPATITQPEPIDRPRQEDASATETRRLKQPATRSKHDHVE